MLKGKRLEEEIERMRHEMEQAAQRLGLSHPEVHLLSKELDGLLNAWVKEQIVSKPHRIYPLGSTSDRVREADVLYFW
ncbi:hypothetical protein JIR001_06990 [Polycladomyces abyssicola]|uniref:Aspartyl-phosphate phosphatase Spo0E family protein n=1 Tax=Polycladomyces abyssicola TaxID=1125966 RepID=A0A8D5UEC5_9BACL|nr:aspartyl-phosphate phosphatase Spo0E family protein [Polycladomyces abyssicola]BCU80916.1 hypothetical protein JIR001_06990 [Polycladomyces abyssicola]